MTTKKKFLKPLLKISPLEPCTLCAGSGINETPGSANTFNNGSLGAKMSGIGTMSRITAAQLGKLDF